MSQMPILKPYTVYRTCPVCQELYPQGHGCPCHAELPPLAGWRLLVAWLGLGVSGLLLWAGLVVLARWAWQLVGGQ